MSDEQQNKLYRPLGLSLGFHITLGVMLTVGWIWHTDQDTVRPPAMMKASLYSAPKSLVKPQQKTQTQKQEKPKPEEVKPEPPKPEVQKPKEVKPEITPTDKPSPIAAKPEKPAPPKPQETKKQLDKKPEPPKPDAKQEEKAQKALSQKQTKKLSKEAEMELEALLNDEDVTRMGDLSDDEIGKWIGLISSRVEENWNRPPNARKDMKVVMEIELLPNGQVVSVSIVESSGDRAFDLAAEQAVYKVEKFEEIATMKPELFEKTFRKFKLLFNPEDLLM